MEKILRKVRVLKYEKPDDSIHGRYRLIREWETEKRGEVNDVLLYIWDNLRLPLEKGDIIELTSYEDPNYPIVTWHRYAGKGSLQLTYHMTKNI